MILSAYFIIWYAIVLVIIVNGESNPSVSIKPSSEDDNSTSTSGTSYIPSDTKYHLTPQDIADKIYRHIHSISVGLLNDTSTISILNTSLQMDLPFALPLSLNLEPGKQI